MNSVLLERLHYALKNLLEEVESRQGMRDAVSSAVISDAHRALMDATGSLSSAPYSRSGRDASLAANVPTYDGRTGELLFPKSNHENKRMLEAIREAKTQIEYLHEKFEPTGSGNSVLARLSLFTERNDKDD